MNISASWCRSQDFLIWVSFQSSLAAHWPQRCFQPFISIQMIHCFPSHLFPVTFPLLQCNIFHQDGPSHPHKLITKNKYIWPCNENTCRCVYLEMILRLMLTCYRPAFSHKYWNFIMSQTLTLSRCRSSLSNRRCNLPQTGGLTARQTVKRHCNTQWGKRK